MKEEQDEVISNVKNIPEKIYLQIGKDVDEGDFSAFSEVTWCKGRINSNDIEYVRVKKQTDVSGSLVDKIKELLPYTEDDGWIRNGYNSREIIKELRAIINFHHP
jgi:hypothetical protein